MLKNFKNQNLNKLVIIKGKREGEHARCTMLYKSQYISNKTKTPIVNFGVYLCLYRAQLHKEVFNLGILNFT